MGSVQRADEAENFLKWNKFSGVSDVVSVPSYCSDSTFFALPIAAGQAVAEEQTVHLTCLLEDNELNKVSDNYFCHRTLILLNIQTFQLSPKPIPQPPLDILPKENSLGSLLTPSLSSRDSSSFPLTCNLT